MTGVEGGSPTCGRGSTTLHGVQKVEAAGLSLVRGWSGK